MRGPAAAVRGQHLSAHVVALVAATVSLPKRHTTNTLVADTGLSRDVVHRSLHALRALGLVDFDGRAGTLHSKLTIVANGTR